MYNHKYFKYKNKYLDLKNNNMIGGNHTQEIYFVRHGETEWNNLGLSQGSKNDIELNNKGELQAQKTGIYLHDKRLESGNFDLILSSPLKRAKKTAKIIAKEVGYTNKIIYLDELIEGDLGLTAIGKTNQEMMDDAFYDEFYKLMEEYSKKDKIDRLESMNGEYPNVFIEKYKIESFENVRSRVKVIIDYIKNCSHKKIIIVSHNGTIDWINRAILNTTDFIKGDMSGGRNCHLTYYILKDNKFKLIMAPSTTHLK
jgi:broad specificity phosphatase PhoE